MIRAVKCQLKEIAEPLAALNGLKIPSAVPVGGSLTPQIYVDCSRLRTVSAAQLTLCCIPFQPESQEFRIQSRNSQKIRSASTSLTSELKMAVPFTGGSESCSYILLTNT